MELQNPWMLAFYGIAMIAICWHFSYGIWLFAAKWGITPGNTARKRFGYVCAGLFLVLVVMGMVSIWAFVGGKYPDVPENPLPAATHLVAPAQLDHARTMLSS
jgi:succinate dehydrogenase / fumarate reductase cytochrome b subunit